MIDDAKKQICRAHRRGRLPTGWRMRPETVEDLISLAANRDIAVGSRPDWLLGYPIHETPTVARGKLTLICEEPAKSSLITIFRSILHTAVKYSDD